MSALIKLLKSNVTLIAIISGLMTTGLVSSCGLIKIGGKIERAKQIERGIKLNDKAAVAHRRAQRPGAAARLRKDYCPAC